MQSSSEAHESDASGEKQVLLAVFDEAVKAEAAVHRLIEKDFPMDKLSLLSKAQRIGDDSLGIYYTNVGERMQGWGKLGAFWGGLWGLLTGAAGLFVIPGLGPVIATGPIVQVIVNTVAGAGVAGGVMAGAAAASQLSVALRQMGIPEERLQALHDAIERGDYIVMLRSTTADLERRRPVLENHAPRDIMACSY